MTENQIATIVVDASIHIHMSIGPGLLDSVYEAVLARELVKRGLRVQRQVAVPIFWEGQQFDEGFRADLIVEDILMIELKSVEKLNRVHEKQLLTYLRLTDRRLGLLINFGEILLKHGIERVANGMPDDDYPGSNNLLARRYPTPE